MDVLESAVRTSRQRHPWERARSYTVRDVLKEKLSKPNMTVLDVGCGDGYLVTELAEQYSTHQFIGFDPERKGLYSVAEASQRPLNLKFIDDLKQGSTASSVDVLLLLDVLEHIDDDATFLEELLKHVKFSNKAEILVTVPSFQCLWSPRDDFLKHYRRYSLSSLSRLISKSVSWKIRHKGYFFFSLLVPRAFQAIWGKFKKNKPKSTSLSSWHINRHLTSIVVFVLILDYKVCRFLASFKIFLPGLSCFLHLQRQ